MAIVVLTVVVFLLDNLGKRGQYSSLNSQYCIFKKILAAHCLKIAVLSQEVDCIDHRYRGVEAVYFNFLQHQSWKTLALLRHGLGLTALHDNQAFCYLESVMAKERLLISVLDVVELEACFYRVLY